MALYHCSVRLCSRRNGRSATGTCAYILGRKMTDEYTGKIYNYAWREDVLYREVLLPDTAPVSLMNVQTLMDAANRAERRSDARIGRVFDMALPREFDMKNWTELVREYARMNFTRNGHAAVVAIHAGGSDPHSTLATAPEREKNNPHVHLLVLTRPLDEKGFQLTKSGSRWMDKVSALVSWRKNWADLLNRYLERSGYRDRVVSHESLARQGIEREPTIHMGARVMALQRKGIRTERGERYQEIQRINKERTRRMNREPEREPECTRSR